jgi:membrane associated rhomboid family serine protease
MFNEPYQSGDAAPTRDSAAVRWLLALNIGVYLLQLTLISPEKIFATLALDPAAFPGAWWTPVTYMFVHVGLWHLGMNMITLWMFGTRLEQAWTTRRFVYFYLWCGIGGAVAHLVFARGAALVGASAGVIGVLLAYALLWPEERVYLLGFIPMRSRWLVAWLIGINIAIGLSAQTLIGWKAHLGGLAFGWLFLRAGSVRGQAGVGRRISTTPDDPDSMSGAIPKTAAMRERSKGIDDEIAHGRSARMNIVLDKISKQGLASLTDEEHRLLDDTSRELRGGPKRS